MAGYEQDYAAIQPKELRDIVQGIVIELSLQINIKTKALKNFNQTGDLRGAFAVKFGLAGFRKDFRLVYDYLPKGQFPEIVRLIAVGPRSEDWVYKTAANRLNS